MRPLHPFTASVRPSYAQYRTKFPTLASLLRTMVLCCLQSAPLGDGSAEKHFTGDVLKVHSSTRWFIKKHLVYYICVHMLSKQPVIVDLCYLASTALLCSPCHCAVQTSSRCGASGDVAGVTFSACNESVFLCMCHCTSTALVRSSTAYVHLRDAQIDDDMQPCCWVCYTTEVSCSKTGKVEQITGISMLKPVRVSFVHHGYSKECVMSSV